MSGFPQTLIWLANNVFGILASMADIVVACVLWSRAAMLLLIASILQLVLMNVGWFCRNFLQTTIDAGGDMTRTMVSFGLVPGLLHAIVYGLLIWAIAAGRGVRRESAPPSVASRG